MSKGHLSSELLSGMSYIYEHWSNSRYMVLMSTINHRFSFQTRLTFYNTSHGWGGEMLSLPPNPCSLLKLLSWVLTCFEYPEQTLPKIPDENCGNMRMKKKKLLKYFTVA